MATIALDSKCHQAIRENGTEGIHYPETDGVAEWRGTRLKGLRSALGLVGHNLEVINIETDSWGDASVLIIAGRHDVVSFSDSELDRIASFSECGGGVLLMANHPKGFVSPQNQVAQRLDLPISFEMAEGKSGSYRLLDHEISKGCGDIHIRTFCRMSVSADPLLTVIAQHTDEKIGKFAVAMEAGNGHSRLVAVGSAGHIASLDDSGSDLFSSDSNSEWTLNTIAWLTRAA